MTGDLAERHAELSGRVTEVGPHEELMASGGGYTRLFALQARGYAGAAAVPGPADGSGSAPQPR